MTLLQRAAFAASALATLACTAHAATVSNIYALVTTGEVYASADSAKTWHIAGTLPIRDGISLYADPFNTGILLLLTRSGSEYFSYDGGATWSATGAAPFDDAVSSHVRFSDGFPFVLTQHGTAYSHSDDGSWIAVGNFAASDCVSLAGANGLHPHVALTRRGVVWTSSNDGIDWRAEGSLGYDNCVGVVAYGNIHLAVTATGEVLTSEDDGISWFVSSVLNQNHIAAINVYGSLVVVSTREGEVATSPDGLTWTWRGSTGQLAVTALGSDVPQVTAVTPPPSSGGLLVLGAPYPNPARGAATVQCTVTLPRGGSVEARLVDARGRTVARQSLAPEAAGAPRIIRWDTAALPAGVFAAEIVTRSGARASTRFVHVR